MTHSHPVRVYYEDTDMAGIVYYANYLKFIERARSDWVRSRGIDQNALRDSELATIKAKLAVIHAVLDYLKVFNQTNCSMNRI